MAALSVEIIRAYSFNQLALCDLLLTFCTLSTRKQYNSPVSYPPLPQLPTTLFRYCGNNDNMALFIISNLY